MANYIYIIDPANTGNLSPTALAQLIPASVRLPASSQIPAVSIVESSVGQPVGISGYAYGFASVVYTTSNSPYDAGSEYFNSNVSQLTLSQIAKQLNENSTIYFGAVQINYPILNLLIANNPTLYTSTTIFSPDIQSAMMTDLAILQISPESMVYAQNTLNLQGISDAVAYYAAEFQLDPLIVLGSYDAHDITTTMGNKFKVLQAQPPEIRNATIYAVVNGLSSRHGGLGTFQGFNSWMLYPTNMTGTGETGDPIQNVTLAGRGNNPGLTNNSQDPINALAYELSQLVYLTQQSLQFAMATISSISTTIAGENVPTLQSLNNQAANALSLIPITPTYVSNPPAANETVVQATQNLQNAYNAYQSDPGNPVLQTTLNIAISQYIQANSINNNINDSVNSAFSQLNTNIIPLANVIVSGSNPFPPLQQVIAANSAALSTPTTSNSSVTDITLTVANTPAGGNINTIASGSTVPSLVTNPTLAMITITGQNVTLAPSAPLNANINLIGSQIYQSLTVAPVQSNSSTINSSSGSN